MPLPVTPDREHLTSDQKDSRIETELHGNQDNAQKIGFADVRNHLSIPVNQLQPKRYLSVDYVPFQRRSTSDIQEALRASTEETQPSMKTENAKDGTFHMGDWRDPENKPLNEERYHSQANDSPRVPRRLSARSRTTSMPKLLESSEEKTCVNITAFNLAAQHTAVNKPVKFREITEPLKKSKWFHALSTIVPLSHFQTAMLEIQKQQEQEKAFEKNQPSMETSFEEIKDCRYLRLPQNITNKEKRRCSLRLETSLCTGDERN